MEKTHSSPLAFLFPWLSPLVITFALTHGGIEVQLYKNKHLISKGQTDRLRKLLPEPLLQWMDDQQFFAGPQPYPLARQVWQNLLPLASKKLIIDATGLAELKESSQPQKVSLVWELSYAEGAIKGRYEGADHYLGMGWFHKGTTLWSLPKPPSNAIDLQLKNLTLPVQQVDMLLNPIIPSLQQHLPTRADFQVISDFKIQVNASAVRLRELPLVWSCNYPQLLPTIQIPEQQIDMLFAEKTLIHFPRQALTPLIKQWLQKKDAGILQGTDIPLFIREQLPIMHQYGQISDEAATQIIKTYPIVSLASVQPSPTFAHSYENGIGKYTTQATYQYQNQTLDVYDLLAAYKKKQRFVYQHATWFEWPADARVLVNAMQQQLSTQILRPEEVMGFDTRRVAFLQKPLPTATIRPDGDTPFKRGQSLFEQLRRHGIAGGIIGEPKGFRAMFAEACENVVRDNRQARILWLVPSNKKGSVTSALKRFPSNRNVTVASLVTLRDEPALITRPWTLVIFQELDHLLDGSMQARRLAQLKWLWVLASVTSRFALKQAAMPVLHLHEQYHDQFCTRYLFDLETNYPQVVVNISHNAQPATPPVSKRELARPVVAPPPASTTQTPRTTPHSQEAIRGLDATIQHRIEEIKAVAQRRLEEFKARELLAKTLHSAAELKQKAQPKPEQTPQAGSISPVKPVPDSSRPKVAPTPTRRSIELNQQKIRKLQEEAEYLQERLTVEDENDETPSLLEPEIAPAAPVAKLTQESAKAAVPASPIRPPQPTKAAPEPVPAPPARPQQPAKPLVERTAPTPQAAISLDPEAISKLHEESAHLHERLANGEEDDETPGSLLEQEMAPAASVANMTTASMPEVDEDWQLIQQAWKAEHWEVLTLLYQGHADQLAEVGQKAHRPLSQLIDDINTPVMDLLGDLLVDPDTQTIAGYLLEETGKLVQWHISSKGR